MFVLSERGNGFPLNFDQMKNLPKFVSNYVSYVPANIVETVISLINLWNPETRDGYSSEVTWFQNGKEVSQKWNYYKIPNVSIDGTIDVSLQGEIDNLHNYVGKIVVSTLGTSKPIAYQSSRHAFVNLDHVERILLSLPETFSDFRIDVSSDYGHYMASAYNERKDFRIMLSGSFDGQAANNFYFEYMGYIFRVGRPNRHTLNHTAKQVQQIDEITRYFPLLASKYEVMTEQMKQIKLTFAQAYKKVFGKYPSEVQRRGKALMQEIEKFYQDTQKETLFDFYLACQMKDKEMGKNRKFGPVSGGYSPYSLKVMKIAEKNYKIKRFA